MICEDGNCPNIAAAVTLTLENGDYLGEPLLGSSGNLVMEDQSFYSEMDEWQTKLVKNWTKEDIVHWINSVARCLNVCCTEMASEKFAQLTGAQLLSHSELDFSKIDINYGEMLYQRLQEKVASENSSPYHQFNNTMGMGYESEESLDGKDPNMIITAIDSFGDETSFRSSLMKGNNGESDLISTPALPIQAPSTPPPPKRKGPGRPKGSKRKKKPEKLGRLWEFLRDLLKNKEYCPSLIVWDNYEEGMFRFVHSDKVAKLWGTKKDNPDMNYEKLSRAMRYYYKSEVLLPVIGRRLVYKFGPNARDWRVDNPNFRE